jgi:hypothetical protein
MTLDEFTFLINHHQQQIEQHQREIDAIKQALAGLRISTGKTGNQWFTIPEPPAKGDGDGGGSRSPAALQPIRRV